MKHHHPSEATLLSYAAGMLPAPHGIVVRTHLALCPDCRRGLGLAAELGGAILAEARPAALAGDALSRTLRRLGDRDTSAPAPRVPITADDFATGRWWWIGPGVRLMPLIRRDHQDARLDLIRVAPGTALPGHGHTGSEITCVLQGAFGDGTGEYHVGDLVESAEDQEHQPFALNAQCDCICLIATTGRMRAHSWLVRLVQPVFGL
ncbi:MAG: cupin domain-containing protein [Acetobacteraceae bacterium]|nr:cupin domain-containing protein [Acetobacteraceae bacterium]